jgi:hypothetical protein
LVGNLAAMSRVGQEKEIVLAELAGGVIQVVA